MNSNELYQKIVQHWIEICADSHGLKTEEKYRALRDYRPCASNVKRILCPEMGNREFRNLFDPLIDCVHLVNRSGHIHLAKQGMLDFIDFHYVVNDREKVIQKLIEQNDSVFTQTKDQLHGVVLKEKEYHLSKTNSRNKERRSFSSSSNTDRVVTVSDPRPILPVEKEKHQRKNTKSVQLYHKITKHSDPHDIISESENPLQFLDQYQFILPTLKYLLDHDVYDYLDERDRKIFVHLLIHIFIDGLSNQVNASTHNEFNLLINKSSDNKKLKELHNLMELAQKGDRSAIQSQLKKLGII